MNQRLNINIFSCYILELLLILQLAKMTIHERMLHVYVILLLRGSNHVMKHILS